MNVRERYYPELMGANASFTSNSTNLGGFLAKTTGTITVTDSAGNVLVDAVPVTAGVLTPIPISFNIIGFTVTLAGGASGTLLL